MVVCCDADVKSVPASSLSCGGKQLYSSPPTTSCLLIRGVLCIPQVFHLGCCDPPLTEVPEGDFVCARCVDESHKDECEMCGKGSTEEDGDLLMCDTEDCPFVSGCAEQYQCEQKSRCL